MVRQKRGIEDSITKLGYVNWAPWGALALGLGLSALLYYDGASTRTIGMFWIGFFFGCIWVFWGVHDSGWFKR
jgi:hypothetical protein